MCVTVSHFQDLLLHGVTSLLQGDPGRKGIKGPDGIDGRSGVPGQKVGRCTQHLCTVAYELSQAKC